MSFHCITTKLRRAKCASVLASIFPAICYAVFVLFMVIFSYGLSILSVGETIILTIIKKKSDDENLLVRNDRDNLFENDLD